MKADFTNIDGIDRALNNLNKTKQLLKDTSKIVGEVAKQGEGIMRSNYMGSGTSASVTSNTAGNTGFIVATGSGLMFEEFGTGYQGLFSGYPSEVLSKVKGVPVTGGYKYYYPSKAKKTVGGKKGWFVPKNVIGTNINSNGFTEGQPAGKQVYLTALQLRLNMDSILQGAIKKYGL